MKRLGERERMFYEGIICALAVVAVHGADTVYDEIVETVDEDDLLYEARRSGTMRWSGLDKFVRRGAAQSREVRSRGWATQLK